MSDRDVSLGLPSSVVRVVPCDASWPRLYQGEADRIIAVAFWREHLAFRDQLRADLTVGAAYAALKHDLAARYPNDRRAYTSGKAAFVAAVLRGTDCQ